MRVGSFPFPSPFPFPIPIPIPIAIVLLTIGCGGFKALPDGGASGDLSVQMGGSGPGPLGALPTGYCCSSSEQCRGRLCAQLGADPNPYYCSDPCTNDTPCAAASTQYNCDNQLMKCVPVNDPYTCIDGANYHYGGAPTGSCCDATRPQAGADCLGGWCISVGGGPGFCTQGCSAKSPCPSGYACNATTAQCWKSQSIADPSAKYDCN